MRLIRLRAPVGPGGKLKRASVYKSVVAEKDCLLLSSSTDIAQEAPSLSFSDNPTILDILPGLSKQATELCGAGHARHPGSQRAGHDQARP